MPDLSLKLLDATFTIHRLPVEFALPMISLGTHYWIARTDEELSVVCDSSIRLEGDQKSEGWSCFKVMGPLPLSMTGVLAGISATLAKVSVSIFVLSTFDTDYILLKAAQLATAARAFRMKGYELLGRVLDEDRG